MSQACCVTARGGNLHQARLPAGRFAPILQFSLLESVVFFLFSAFCSFQFHTIENGGVFLSSVLRILLSPFVLPNGTCAENDLNTPGDKFLSTHSRCSERRLYIQMNRKEAPWW